MTEQEAMERCDMLMNSFSINHGIYDAFKDNEKGYPTFKIMREFTEMCKEALEKQIAKKPTEVDERMPEDYAEYYYLAFMCPSCGGSVTGQPYRPNYCKHCGQKLDWSEV